MSQLNENCFLGDLTRLIQAHVLTNSDLLSEAGVDQCFNSLVSSIQTTLDKHCPLTQPKVRCDFHSPWMNHSILKLIEQRNFFHSDALLTHSTDSWNIYRFYKNLVTAEIRRTKSNHFLKQLDASSNNPKRLWRTLFESIGKASSPSSLNNLDPNDVNKFFTDSAFNILNNLFPSDIAPDFPGIISYNPFPHLPPSFSIPFITKSSLFQYIYNPCLPLLLVLMEFPPK